MFDAQAWYVRDIILGRIEVPDRDGRVADVDDRVARESTVKDAYDEIRCQGDYVKELVADTDYPSLDVDGTNTRRSSSGRSTRLRTLWRSVTTALSL